MQAKNGLEEDRFTRTRQANDQVALTLVKIHVNAAKHVLLPKGLV
jgi:hypothetical protein